LRGKYLAEVQQKILALHAEKRAEYEAKQNN
jgi:hypothetical protein